MSKNLNNEVFSKSTIDQFSNKYNLYEKIESNKFKKMNLSINEMDSKIVEKQSDDPLFSKSNVDFERLSPEEKKKYYQSINCYSPRPKR